jgi:chemotaxis protein histidine kinase CheA/CheY-like chemotaxis protein
VDPELVSLVPLFCDEARDRLERLAALAPRLPHSGGELEEARRELHTLKGAARMLRIGAMAELCHAAEELLASPPADCGRRLTRALDGLALMVDTVADGGEPRPDPALVAGLGGRAPTAALPVGGSSPPAGARVEELRVEAAALDALGERAAQVRSLALAGRQGVERLYQLAALADRGMDEPQPERILAVLGAMLRRAAVDLEGNQQRLARAAEEQVERALSLELQPLRGLLQRLARAARDLGDALGREVEVEVAGEETRLDRRIVRQLEEALLHLTRNAVDHGIEPAAERERAGKSPTGHIRLAAAAAGGRVRLEITDDGAGVDPQVVLRRAVDSGRLTAEVAAGLEPREVLRLLLLPGFTLRPEVSETSGRGVGLDAVAAAVGRVGGDLAIDSQPGGGTRIAIEVPVGRRGESVLVVRVGDLRLALPAGAARQATRLPATRLVEREGQLLALLGDRQVRCASLARLFGRVPAEAPLLVEGSSAGQPLAVLVDEVEGEQEVLVRPLPRAAAHRLVDGMALLASGEPVAVLSPAALARDDGGAAAPIPTGPASRRVRVLLVEDSPVTRELERRLLEGAGFEVRAAADAEEALASLAAGDVDCVVTDIEMPGVDGLELTARLRALERYAHLPVVVVSNRDRPEDRLRGLQAGADAYLTKQALNAGELVELVRRLGGG